MNAQVKLEEMINPKTGLPYYYKDNKDHKGKYRKAKATAVKLAKILQGTHGMETDKEFISVITHDILYNGLVIDVANWDGFDAEKTKLGFVYAVTNPAWPDKIKIGRTENPQRRVAQLQTGDPHKAYSMVYCKFFTDCHMAEHQAHEAAATRSPTQNGEWFTLAKYEVVNIIKDL